MDALLFVRALVALVFVLSLIGGLAWLARRFGLMQQMQPGRQLKVLESCGIDARTKLILFRVGEKHHAALVGANGCQIIDEDVELTEIPDVEPQDLSSVIKWPAGLQALKSGTRS